MPGILPVTNFAKVLTDAKRPMIVLGAGALTRKDGTEGPERTLLDTFTDQVVRAAARASSPSTGSRS